MNICVTTTFLIFSCGLLNAQENKDVFLKWEMGVQLSACEQKTPLEEMYGTSSYGWNDDFLFANHANDNSFVKHFAYGIKGLGVYHFNKNFFTRISGGFNIMSIEHSPEEYSDQNGLYLITHDASKKRIDFLSAIGLGKRISIDQFNFYSGFELPFVFYGKSSVHYFTELKDASSGTKNSSEELTGEIFGSLSMGIGNFAGFDFEFKNFSLGGEIAYLFQYCKSTSESNFQIIEIDYVSNNTTVTNTKESPHISDFGFSKIKPSIHIMYSF
jgi:hypothetical protein